MLLLNLKPGVLKATLNCLETTQFLINQLEKFVFHFLVSSKFVLLEKRLRGVYKFLNFVRRANNSNNSLFPNLHSIQRFYSKLKTFYPPAWNLCV